MISPGGWNSCEIESFWERLQQQQHLREIDVDVELRALEPVGRVAEGDLVDADRAVQLTDLDLERR